MWFNACVLFQIPSPTFWQCKLCPRENYSGGILKRHSLRFHLAQQHECDLRRTRLSFNTWQDQIVPLEGDNLRLQTKRVYLRHASKSDRLRMYAELHQEAMISRILAADNPPQDGGDDREIMNNFKISVEQDENPPEVIYTVPMNEGKLHAGYKPAGFMETDNDSSSSDGTDLPSIRESSPETWELAVDRTSFLTDLSLEAGSCAVNAANSVSVAGDMFPINAIVTDAQLDSESVEIKQTCNTPPLKIAKTVCTATAGVPEDEEDSVRQPICMQGSLRQKDVMIQIVAELNTFRTDSVEQIKQRITRRNPDILESDIGDWLQMSLLSEQAVVTKLRSIVNHAVQIDSTGKLAIAMVSQELCERASRID